MRGGCLFPYLNIFFWFVSAYRNKPNQKQWRFNSNQKIKWSERFYTTIFDILDWIIIKLFFFFFCKPHKISQQLDLQTYHNTSLTRRIEAMQDELNSVCCCCFFYISKWRDFLILVLIFYYLLIQKTYKSLSRKSANIDHLAATQVLSSELESKILENGIT